MADRNKEDSCIVCGAKLCGEVKVGAAKVSVGVNPESAFEVLP